MLVEVTARFDEASNIEWAQILENAGVHVAYGLVGLKTHTKATLILRHERAWHPTVLSHWHRQLQLQDGAALHRSGVADLPTRVRA